MAAKVYLTGKFLIAMPQMQDSRFSNAVVYICGHDKHGAMGLVINKLIDSLTLFELLQQLDITPENMKSDLQIHFGGPVEMGRGFVLHTNDYMQKESVDIANGIALTATADILQEIATGEGPKKCLLALGYAGWSPGQLESEIQSNGWLQSEADANLIFTEDVDSVWEKAIEKLGIDPTMLSWDAGHA